MVERVSVDADRPSGAALVRAAAAIRAGGIVAYPTETYYGLAVDPCQPAAVAGLRSAKDRTAASPFPLIAADVDQLAVLRLEWSDQGRRLARRFWPGPLTLVLRAGVAMPEGVLGPGSTLAVRVPGCRVARALARAVDGPVTSTSANRSGYPPTVSPDDVAAAMGTRIDLLLDGGTTPGGQASTVVDVTGEAPRLVRAGLVAWARVLESLEA